MPPAEDNTKIRRVPSEQHLPQLCQQLFTERCWESIVHSYCTWAHDPYPYRHDPYEYDPS